MNPFSTPIQHFSPPFHLPSRLHVLPPKTTTIDMFPNNDGSYSALNHRRVAVLWDLDNKPPRGPPFPAAISLRRLAENLGRVVEFSAFANRHAFLHLPQWVREDRRHRKHLHFMERKRLLVPTNPYLCPVCGRKCTTSFDLKRHFIQLHERERSKKVNRMRSLKGKKRESYRKRFVEGNWKYEEAAREILVPKKGYGLAGELRRAGVVVKMVEDKPEAADTAVRRRMKDWMSRGGVDFLVLVSDDAGFEEMIGKGREEGVETVVVGDVKRVLGRVADFWVSWERVEKGEEVLLGRKEEDVEEELFYEEDVYYDDDDDDDDGESLSWIIEEDEEDCYI